MTNYTTLGGRVTCTQCNALSKRSRQRCQAPAIKGKTKCRFHGGKSTGAKTEHGKQRIALSKTVHGRETRAKRRESSEQLSELCHIEDLMFALDMFPKGTERKRGRKPVHMSKDARVWADLAQQAKSQRIDFVQQAIINRLRKNITG